MERPPGEPDILKLPVPDRRQPKPVPDDEVMTPWGRRLRSRPQDTPPYVDFSPDGNQDSSQNKD